MSDIEEIIIKRAYTVKEIDELRIVVELRWIWGTSNRAKQPRASRSYNDAKKDIVVEQLVRTHMLAGHIANDLYEADK